MEAVKIGIAGLGTVGGGTYAVLFASSAFVPGFDPLSFERCSLLSNGRLNLSLL
mgnify:CR=1 FL=1